MSLISPAPCRFLSRLGSIQRPSTRSSGALSARRIRTTRRAGKGWLLWLRDLGTGYHQLGFDRFRDGTNQGVLASTVVLELNEYSHVAATFDGNNVKIYLNGAEVGTANYGSPNSLKDTSDDFKLGDSSAGGANFLGRIDEAAVYDYALSPAAVSRHYADSVYSYDDLYRLTKSTYADQSSDTFTYDAVGNRLTEDTDDYTYNAADQLTDLEGVSFGYDNNGNLTSRGSDTFSWNAADQMTSTTVSSVTTTFAYNGDGLRESLTTGGVTTTFTWDAMRSIPQVLDDGDLRYIYGLGRIGQVDDNELTHYYLNDGLGWWP